MKRKSDSYSPIGIATLIVVFTVIAILYSIFLRHNQPATVVETETLDEQEFEETQVTVEENSYDSIVIKVPYDEIAVGSTFEVVESPTQENLYEIRIDELTIAEITFVSSDENAVQFDSEHLYVLRTIPKTADQFQDELWKYDLEGSGTKIFSAKGLSYEIQSNQDLIAINPGSAQVVLLTNKSGAVVQSVDVNQLLNSEDSEIPESTESAEPKKIEGIILSTLWQGQSNLLITLELKDETTKTISYNTTTNTFEEVSQ